jgi:phage terminase small subunit
MALNTKQKRFVEEYLVDLNGTQAAIRAGYAVIGAATQASRLLLNVEIQALISAGRDQMADTTGITAEKVLERWWQLATANPAEVSQYRRGACRYCHGFDNEYHWIDEAEFARQVKENPDRNLDDFGGYGFKRLARPADDCPRCEGEGIQEAWFADTRDLSPKAALLFDGVKRTVNGIEIKVKDQAAALVQVAKHLGMFTEQVDLSSKDGTMTPTAITRRIVDPSDDDDDDL